MGRDNGQMVLAEGVETEDEVMLMESLGVDLFQGYYFGKPKPAAEFTIATVSRELAEATV
jgi:EAL domain-containing protein (putative c-di-GMP-specific phosphodiesterase class I)